MVEPGLEGREDPEPERETDDRPNHRADGADDGAVRQQHESQVLRCRAGRGKHAELAESSLRDDGEARGGDQRGQEQEDGGHREHRQRARPLAVPPPCGGPGPGGPAGLLTGTKAVDRSGVRGDQQRDGVGRSCGCRRDKGELVCQVTGVLDDADDGPATAIEGQRVPDLEREEVGHTVGHGYLPGTLRVTAPAECEQLACEDAVRILGAELHAVDAAGDSDRAVADHLGRPEPLPGGVESRLERSRIGSVESQEVAGRAELCVVRGT